MLNIKYLFIWIVLYTFQTGFAQKTSLTGVVISEGRPVQFAKISLVNHSFFAETDSLGFYIINNIPVGTYQVQVWHSNFSLVKKTITIKQGDAAQLNFDLTNFENKLDEVVITGTLKEVSRLESPVPVEVYIPAYFKKNPTPSVFDALQNVNGVRPQLNCNVCNTGDIHINGLEGPYTMILIDGMPIVSSLSSVYGLSGIPNSIIERVEIVKGPASSLYGSEAVGGLINIVTKKPLNSALFSLDVFSTSWLENSVDLSIRSKLTKNVTALTGISYFNFQNKVDQNKDNFTDLTLQHRISVFQKWNFKRKDKRILNLAGRYLYEDRWGGDLRWNETFRGGDSIYGESIYTNRWEILGNYQLPTNEIFMLSFSFNNHDQNSRYGNTSYIAQQNVAFSQLTWDKKIRKNDFLVGVAARYTFYDDNTPATFDSLGSESRPQKTWLPGVFVQNELSFTEKQKLLVGLRFDYHFIHGPILTPRLAYKWTINAKNIFRINAGTGFRVVNLFTEDHAALTGARTIEIKNELNPEQSFNVNLNYVKKIFTKKGSFIGLDGSLFYTYFNNRIVGDYDSDPNKIIYDNLSGFATSKGINLNVEVNFKWGLKIITGGTLMGNTLTENGKTTQQILTEKFTGIWSISYKINPLKLTIDYTGNLYSPMRLPVLGANDPRSEMSPWWSIQNIQFVYNGFKKIELYWGIKNLLNWTPNKGNPFIIARSHDPFDKKVIFGIDGQAIATAENPYGLTFDPNYVFAPNQGIRFFLGVRITLN